MSAESQAVKKLNADQIAAILADHKLWVSSQGGKQADLRFADLRLANLRSADLRLANLSSANLHSADLRFADLYSANLRSANLRSADLSFANLSSANLRSADLSFANLSSANLEGAQLKDAKDAELVLARTEIVPREGEVVGWKKCRSGVLVKVGVPPMAKRSNALGRKCRAEFVHVIEVVGSEVGVSMHDGKTEYRAGQVVKCDNWDTNRLNECSGGIHFFLTREEAQDFDM